MNQPSTKNNSFYYHSSFNILFKYLSQGRAFSAPSKLNWMLFFVPLAWQSLGIYVINLCALLPFLDSNLCVIFIFAFLVSITMQNIWGTLKNNIIRTTICCLPHVSGECFLNQRDPGTTLWQFTSYGISETDITYYHCDIKKCFQFSCYFKNSTGHFYFPYLMFLMQSSFTCTCYPFIYTALKRYTFSDCYLLHTQFSIFPLT